MSSVDVIVDEHATQKIPTSKQAVLMGRSYQGLDGSFSEGVTTLRHGRGMLKQTRGTIDASGLAIACASASDVASAMPASSSFASWIPASSGAVPSGGM